MPRYAPAARLARLRTLLRASRATLPQLAERLAVSPSTVRRLLKALEDAGEPLSEETLSDGRKAWKLERDARSGGDSARHDVSLSTPQLLALLIARNGAREMLRGTGFDDDLDAACAALVATLRGKDAELAKDLDRKLHDRGEMPMDHSGHADALDEITTAILKSERLDLRRRASDGEERTHPFDPYSLVTYKKGLYVVGYSHHHAQRVSLGIDAIVEATRRRGETFVYPADYSPAAMFEGSIGMFVGPMTHVVVRFAKEAKRYVLRRRIHGSQRVVESHADGAIDLALHIAGTTELESLVLSYGDRAEVRSPPALREKLGQVLRRAAERYGG